MRYLFPDSCLSHPSLPVPMAVSSLGGAGVAQGQLPAIQPSSATSCVAPPRPCLDLLGDEIGTAPATAVSIAGVGLLRYWGNYLCGGCGGYLFGLRISLSTNGPSVNKHSAGHRVAEGVVAQIQDLWSL